MGFVGSLLFADVTTIDPEGLYGSHIRHSRALMTPFAAMFVIAGRAWYRHWSGL
jgi:hypothetical protein